MDADGCSNDNCDAMNIWNHFLYDVSMPILQG